MGFAKALALISALSLPPAASGHTIVSPAAADDDLEISFYNLFLSCSDQSEFVVFPDWCGEVLETRDLTPAPSGND